MEILIPIAAGAFCGVLSAVPYAVAFSVLKRRRDASIVPAVAAVVVSLAVIGLSTLIGWLAFRSSVIVFAVALVALFLAAVCTCAALFVRKPRP